MGPVLQNLPRGAQQPCPAQVFLLLACKRPGLSRGLCQKNIQAHCRLLQRHVAPFAGKARDGRRKLRYSAHLSAPLPRVLGELLLRDFQAAPAVLQPALQLRRPPPLGLQLRHRRRRPPAAGELPVAGGSGRVRKHQLMQQRLALKQD